LLFYYALPLAIMYTSVKDETIAPQWLLAKKVSNLETTIGYIKNSKIT
jgi:hypothetical protein